MLHLVGPAGEGMAPFAYGDVDLNLLLVLERVLARQSVAEAAQDLGLSASATSRALQRLRDTLGDPLLVRAGNRLVPTERARGLQELAERAVHAARAVYESGAAFDPQTDRGAVVLGLGEELQQTLFPTIFARLREDAPGIDVRIRNLTMQTHEEGKRDALHMAIVPDLSTIPSIRGLPDVTELVHQTLYVRHFVVVGAADAWPEAPDLDTYVAADHAIMTEEAGARGFMDDLLDAQGRARRVVCSMSSFGAVAQVVRTSSVLALMPAEVATRLVDGLVAHPPPIPIPSMEMRLMWHPRHTTQARHRFVRQVVADGVRTATRLSSTAMAATTTISPPK